MKLAAVDLHQMTIEERQGASEKISYSNHQLYNFYKKIY